MLGLGLGLGLGLAITLAVTPAAGVMVGMEAARLHRNQAGSAFGQLALRRLLSARTRSWLGLPGASASLGQSAAWPALAGHTSLAFDMQDQQVFVG